MEALVYFKQLTNFSCNKLKLYAISGSVGSVNYYFFLFNTLNIFEKNILNCLLFSTNPKIEATLINFKLKLKYQKSLLSIFSFGSIFYNSIKISFLNLSFKSIFLVLEAKRKKVTSLLLAHMLPLIIFGYSFLQRFKNYFSLSLFIKTKINNIAILKLNKYSNDEGILLLNIKNYFKMNKISNLYCINLYDHLSLRKDALLSAKNNI